jgi:hypothetical protein
MWAATDFARRANQLKVIGMMKAQNGPKTARAETRFSRGVGRFKARRENISLFQKIKSGVWSAHPATEKRGVSRSSRT